MNTAVSALLLVCFAQLGCASYLSSSDNCDHLLYEARSLSKRRDVWLAENNNESTSMILDENQLPESLRALGYTEATIDSEYLALKRKTRPNQFTFVSTIPNKPLPITLLYGSKKVDLHHRGIITIIKEAEPSNR